MEIWLVVAFRKRKPHASKATVTRKWVRTQDGVERLLVLSPTNKMPAFGDFILDQIQAFVILDNPSQLRVLFTVDPILPGLNADTNLTSWSMQLQLKMDAASPGADRMLRSTVTLTSCWKVPEEKYVFEAVEMIQNNQGMGLEFDDQGQISYPEDKLMDEQETRIACPPLAGGLNTDAISVGQMIDDLCCGILSDECGVKQVIRCVQGPMAVRGLEDSWRGFLGWIKDNLEIKGQTYPDSTTINEKLFGIVQNQQILYNNIAMLLLDPFVADPTTINKSLADPLFENLDQLMDILQSPDGWYDKLRNLQFVSWMKILTCLFVSNRIFFQALITGLLQTDYPSLQALLNGTTQKSIFEADSDIHFFKRALKNMLKELAVMEQSSCLFAADCPIEAMGGEVQANQCEGDIYLYQDFCLGHIETHLELWKTTTAEDRARGKIYLRGFTKVDPVEDRLEV